MAFNFPNAPSLNQVFTPTAGVSFIWTGTQWDRVAPSLLTIPPGIYVPYAGPTEPLGWLFCDGRAISRAAYPLLFTAIGTSHGAGDGNTTFNLPDMRGRAAFGRDNMGGTAAGRITDAGVGNPAINGNVIGAAGGLDRRVMAIAQLPTHNHTLTDPKHGHVLTDPTHGHSVYDPTHYHPINDPTHVHTFPGTDLTDGTGAAQGTANRHVNLTTFGAATGVYNSYAATNISLYGIATGITMATASTGISIAPVGSSEPYPMMPPALIANYIIFAGL